MEYIIAKQKGKIHLHLAKLLVGPQKALFFSYFFCIYFSVISVMSYDVLCLYV